MGDLTFFLGLQVKQKDDGIFISQDKYVTDILKKFDFATVRTASTPMETNIALLKDEEAADVDVHLYRLMTGSLMYLTTSKPDIMFAVCACARFQVTPKTSQLHAVKRIFRYLKGHPKLGLWYPRDSSFDLEAFSDSDYAGASLDRKSTTREYVAATSCCGRVIWIQNQLLDYGYNFMNTKIFINNESTICIVKNPVFHSKTKHIEIRHHFIRDSYEKRLIQVIKIHTDHNVVDLLTKSSGPIPLITYETVIKEWEDRTERAATAASSLVAEQDSGNINRTQSMAILNEFFPQGTGSVAFLEKPEESNRATAKAKTVNGERQIQALVDKKKVIITEKSVRSDLMLDDAAGTECLPNDVIFEQLTLMGMGEDSAAPTDSHSTPIVTQLSSSKPQKKKSRRKQKKNNHPTEPILDEATNEEPISTHSYDPPQSGEDILQLTELMTLCTKLQKQVFDLEEAKTAQAKEIASLEKREDASKQGRKIADPDADEEVTLIDETQERYGEEMLFDVQDDLQGEEVVTEKEVAEKEVSAADLVTTTGEVVTTANTTTTVDELTLAQTLIEIKAAKPKAVIIAATKTTRPKAKGVVVQEPKASRVTIIEELDSIQAMIDADEQLAARLQAEEQEYIYIEEKSRMLVKMIAKRKKFFAAQRAAEQRSKPPTKNQIRNRMCTYLKNMGGYKHNQLKGRSYKEFQKLFDKAYKQVSSFIPMDSEVVKISVTRTKGSSKRAGDDLESNKSKKQKISPYTYNNLKHAEQKALS
ncbi:hypothetical protein Tco_1328529 [Tanacetum coccineum]